MQVTWMRIIIAGWDKFKNSCLSLIPVNLYLYE